MLKEEVISSLELEDYLNNFINDETNGLKEKIIMSSFLEPYMDKDLYVVEFFRDKGFYIRVENSEDEILSHELYLGEEVTKKEETIEDFDLLRGTDHTINFYVNSILEDESISPVDMVFMIKDFLKYINKGYYRMDAEDKDGNMLQLILEQKTDKIIDKIYY